MSASNVHKEFCRKRRLLSFLKEQHASERLAAMWKFLDSKEETRQIIEKINKENPEISALIREGQPAKGGSEGEIIAVGLYVMEVCHESNKHLTSIAKRLGLVSTYKGATRQSYVDDAMNGYVHYALDFIEGELEAMVDKEKITEQKDNTKVDNSLQTEQLPQKILDKEKAKKDRLQGLFRQTDNSEPPRVPPVATETPDDMNKIRREFIDFLTGIKKWPSNYIQDFVVAGYIGKAGVVDLSIIRPDSGKIIAIIEFMSNLNPDILQKANSLVRLHRDALNQPAILGYIVTPKEKNVRHSFDIYQVSKHNYPELISVEKFIGYLGSEGVTLDIEEPKNKRDVSTDRLSEFLHICDSRSRELCNKIIDRAKLEDLDFSVETDDASYINFKTKTPIKTAMQLHRWEGTSGKIALAVAGRGALHLDLFSTSLIKLVMKGIGQLSGFRYGNANEKRWLEGHMKGLDREAGVYVISDEVLDDPKAWKELEKLLKLAKGYAGSKEPAEQEAELFEEYYQLLAPTSKRIIQAASEMALKDGEGTPLTTSLILFKMIELGDSSNRRLNTAKFLRDRILKKSSLDNIVKCREHYLPHAKNKFYKWNIINTDSSGPVVSFVPKILKMAAEYADKVTRDKEIHVRHLLAALLLYRAAEGATGIGDRLREMGTSIEWVLRGFAEYVKQFKKDDQKAWTEILGLPPETTAKKNNHVNEFCIGDSETHEDTLGFKPYVAAVAKFLTHEKTELPLTLSIEGEWGSGKSSFMLQLQDAIKATCKDNLIVKFDPWRHDKEDALWAAFALSFLKQVRGGFFRRRHWAGEWNLLWSRFSWKDGWFNVLKIVSFTIFCLFVAILVFKRGPDWVTEFCNKVLGLSTVDGSKSWIDGIVEKTLGWSGAGALLASLLAIGKKVVGHPFEMNLKKYIQHPDYSGKVSFVEKFHNDFSKIVKAYAGDKRIFVFIEDLDRCKIPKAAELMESINLMLSKEPNLVFVMGMDREKVAAGLAVRHEKLLPYLSSEAEAEMKDGNCKRRWGIRYGYSFIEKFIQVPFLLPMPTEESIKGMLKSLSGEIQSVEKLKEQKKAMKAEVGGEFEGQEITEDEINERIEQAEKREVEEKVESQDREVRMEEVQVKFEPQPKNDGDSSSFTAIVLMVSEALKHNPRRVKQFMNIFRLHANIAASLNKLKPDNSKGVEFEQLGKVVAIQFACPLFTKDVEAEPEIFKRIVEIAEDNLDVNESKESKKVIHWCKDVKLKRLIISGNEHEDTHLYSLKDVDILSLLRIYGTIGSGSNNVS